VVVEGTPDELKGELKGDAVHVELDGADGLARAEAALARLSGVAEVARDGRSLRARVARGAAAVPSVLAALDAEGVPVASVMVSRPSLDDVYLRYAGRAFAAADREGSR
jgi:ABC-2 type transport system ATP-binding protein